MKTSPILGILIVTVFAISGCQFAKKNKESLPAVSKNILTVTVLDSIQDLDWNLSTDSTASLVEANVMEGLTRLDIQKNDVAVVPALAESWKSEDGGFQFTFTLRSDVTWSDGKPLMAQQFVDSFERLLSSSSPWAESLFVIKGARIFHDGKSKNFSEVGIKAVDEKTLRMTLNEPVGYFLALFSHHSTFPIRKELIEENKSDWAQPGHVVTLGAYKVGSFDSDELVLTRNENFALKRPQLKEIDVELNTSPEDAVDSFKSKETDVVINIPPSVLKNGPSKNNIAFTSLFDVTYLTFNVRQKPLSNPIFRRVIGMSIDRDDLIHNLNSAKVTRGMVPPGLIGYESNRGVRFDPDAAKELLRHSGYVSMEKYEPIYLLVNLASEAQAAGINVQGQLKKALGIDVKLVFSEKEIPKNSRVIYLSHWAASVPDPDNFMALFTSMSLNNPTGWKDFNYDQYVRQAATASGVEARERLYAKAQHILTETEMPVIPLYLNTQFCLIGDNVKGFPLNSLSFMPLGGVSLE